MYKKYSKSKATGVKKRGSFKKTVTPRRRTVAPRIAAMRPEIKWITGNQNGDVAGTISTSTDFTVALVTGTSTPIKGIATPKQGSGPNERIGNAITCYSLDMALQFTNLVTTYQDFRVIVFLDKMCTGIAPGVIDLLANGAVTDAYKMPFYPVDPIKESRFKILYDSQFVIDAYGLGQMKVLNLKIPIRNTVIRFSKAGGASISAYADFVSNWIGFAIIPSQNTATTDGVKVAGISILRYTDA